MKILWKNVWYNLVARWYCWFRYRWAGQHKDSYYPLANWSCWYYPQFKCWTQGQQDQFDDKLAYYMRNLRFMPPFVLHPNTDPDQQLPTPRQSEQDDPNDQRTEDTH